MKYYIESYIFIYLNIFFALNAYKGYEISENINERLNQYKLINVNNNLRNLNSDKKNVIIGIIKDYSWDKIKTFFISFVTAQYKNTDLVMFISNVPEETIDKIKLCGTIIKDLPGTESGLRDLAIVRWKIYSDFLKENKDKYNLVFSVDVRDLLFQGDIFDYYQNYKSFIGFAYEDSTLIQPNNLEWVKQISKNDEEAKEIMDKRIICGGTILGSIEEFIQFSESLYEFMKSFSFKVVDQGAINYIIYTRKLLKDHIVGKGNENGYIMTLCITNRSNIKLDSDDNVLNFKGEVAAIVHQYDRKPDITEMMQRKYSDEVFDQYINKTLNFSRFNKYKKLNNNFAAKNKIKRIIKIILFGTVFISIFFKALLLIKKLSILKKSKKETAFKKKKFKFLAIIKNKRLKKTISLNIDKEKLMSDNSKNT